MNKGKSHFGRLPFFVLIFSVYPSLALLSTNIREVYPSVVFRPLVISLLGGFILALLLWSLLKDWTRASLGTLVVLLFFFSYGHIARLLIDRFDPDYNKFIEIALYLFILVIGYFAFRWIVKRPTGFMDWMGFLNTIALVLILFPLFQIFSMRRAATRPSEDANPTPASGNVPTTSQGTPTTDSSPPGRITEYPDVYLIVLDGYARGDTLMATGYDNSPFLNSLEEMGFFVAECSRTTYRSTLLSMTSTLNMDYLWRAIPNTGPADPDAAPLYEALLHSQVRSDFEQRGYTIVGFESGYQWDEWTDADKYITIRDDPANAEFPASSITEFEYIFLRNTVAYPLFENSIFAVQRYYDHYNRVLYQLDELPKVASSVPGPKFVYAHIMAPHTPFIFLPDGSLNTDSRFYNLENGTPSNSALWTEDISTGIEFLNSRMTGILSEIINNSKIPPIIVLQGDHGYLIGERRYNNLMAFYLPNGGNLSLYDTITPVNTFRLINNLYFGTDLKLRNDVSLDADFGRPYARKAVKPYPETCP